LNWHGKLKAQPCFVALEIYKQEVPKSNWIINLKELLSMIVDLIKNLSNQIGKRSIVTVDLSQKKFLTDKEVRMYLETSRTTIEDLRNSLDWKLGVHYFVHPTKPGLRLYLKEAIEKGIEASWK